MQNVDQSPESEPKVREFTETIPDNLQQVRQHRCKVCGKVVFEFYKTKDGREIVVVQCHGVRQVVEKTGRRFTTRCKTKHWVALAKE